MGLFNVLGKVLGAAWNETYNRAQEANLRMQEANKDISSKSDKELLDTYRNDRDVYHKVAAAREYKRRLDKRNGE